MVPFVHLWSWAHSFGWPQTVKFHPFVMSSVSLCLFTFQGFYLGRVQVVKFIVLFFKKLSSFHFAFFPPTLLNPWSVTYSISRSLKKYFKTWIVGYIAEDDFPFILQAWVNYLRAIHERSDNALDRLLQCGSAYSLEIWNGVEIKSLGVTVSSFLFLFTEFINLILLSPCNSLILPFFLLYFIL